MNHNRLAFVDIETTGTRPMYDRIIEIGVILTDSSKTVQTWSTLINPHRHLDPIITQITGITPDQLLNSPSFQDIHPKLKSLLEGRIFVAHNVRFDYGFVKHEFDRLGDTFTFPQLCTIKLSRRLYPSYRKHGLDKIIQRFSIDCPNRHRALDDAQAIKDFYLISTKKFGHTKVDQLVKQITTNPSLPAYIDPSTVSSLPSCPGVYLFYGDNNHLLYVGKSVNIKNRVTSHFYTDFASVKEMRIKQKIRHIQAIPTAGELGALLKESHLIKTLKPHYNSMLTKKKSFLLVFTHKNKHGYLVPQLVKSSTIQTSRIQSIQAVYKTTRQAKQSLSILAKDHQLCAKLMGIEKSKGPCFGYHLNTCKGACLTNEHPKSYNLRVTTAFANIKFKAWPFPGPISISEFNSQTDQQEVHVFNLWCHLDTYQTISDFYEQTTPINLAFDIDTYNILNRHLLKNPGVATRIDQPKTHHKYA